MAMSDDASLSRPRLPRRFRRVRSAPNTSGHESSPVPSTSPNHTTIRDLPDEVLQLVCLHAIRSHESQTWITPADLAGRTAQAWLRVSRPFHQAFHAAIPRFSFFLVNPHASTPRAAATHAHVMPTLARCANMRELQLFIRPRDVCVLDAVSRFFKTSTAPLSTVHLCCAPPAIGDTLRAGDPLPVVTDLIRAICTRGNRLQALSLDCCNTLSHTSARLLADEVGPTLQRLALDVTFFQDWTVLSRFSSLVELRLQNTRLISDCALRHVLQHLPSLEVFEMHQVPAVSGAGLKPLATVGRLRSIQLSRCIGIDNEAILDLARIPTLSCVSLCYIDVSSFTLQKFAKEMGLRLKSLAVNSVSTDGIAGTLEFGRHVVSSSQEMCLHELLETVRTHCKNVETIDFSDTSRPTSHWSVRPFEEALRHSSSPTSCALFPSAPRQSLFRRRSYRRALDGRSRWTSMPLNCCF